MTFNFNTVCPAQPSALDFGGVPLGCFADASFTIRNDSVSTLTGDVTETCDYFDILSGGGPFSLATGESLIVNLRFEPTVMGNFSCTIGIGGAGYCDVYCTGEGLSASDICDVYPTNPTKLDFGAITMGDSLDLDFAIYNVGCDTMSGTVSANCINYEIVSSITAESSRARIRCGSSASSAAGSASRPGSSSSVATPPSSDCFA